MKINEVEAREGITKKNIRFYEQEGLLSPRRNSENGYREYSEREVDSLMRIKLLRKLGLPLEEIRRMQSGQITVGDAMRRHLVTLERERGNLEQAAQMCRQLGQVDQRLETLDAQMLLEQMEDMEQGGVTFMNKQTGDVRRRYLPPAVAAAVMIVLMAAVIALLVWAFKVEQPATPKFFLLVVIALPAVVIVGVLMAMVQRWREIGKGEEDEAKKY